jgi:uncharacterized protein YecE (DUF72 family)
MIRIGTSGWSYDHWQGVLYPPHTPVSKRLGYYLPHFDTVEVNSTYYRWPPDTTFASWNRRLPEGFLMTVKAPRGLTHFARLHEPEAWMERIRGGLERLGEKLGVFLVQLPPQFASDLPRLEHFLAQTTGLKVAVEFRHPSWNQEVTFQILERLGVAYCVMSGAQLPCILRVTAPFVYVRLHGPDPEHLYGGSYSENDLHWWAERIREWTAAGHDVFAYFNNDTQGNAVRNALRLKELLNA